MGEDVQDSGKWRDTLYDPLWRPLTASAERRRRKMLSESTDWTLNFSRPHSWALLSLSLHFHFLKWHKNAHIDWRAKYNMSLFLLYIPEAHSWSLQSHRWREEVFRWIPEQQPVSWPASLMGIYCWRRKHVKNVGYGNVWWIMSKKFTII